MARSDLVVGESEKARLEMQKKKGSAKALPFYLERQKSLELSTYTLARYRSTN